MFVCFYPLFCWLVSHGNHHVLTHVQCFYWDWSHSNNDDLKLKKKKMREQRVFGVRLTFKPYRIRNFDKRMNNWALPGIYSRCTFQTHRKPSHTEWNLVMDSVPLGTMTDYSVPASLSNFSHNYNNILKNYWTFEKRTKSWNESTCK